MVSAHPNAVDSARQAPKLGDFFSPYQQQPPLLSSLIEGVFESGHYRPLSGTSQTLRQQQQQHQTGNALANRQTATQQQQPQRRSPLANTTNQQQQQLMQHAVTRPQPLMAAGGVGNQENPGLPRSHSGNIPKNPKLYKTELCRSWMDHGRCNYGERCQYAHGEAEKRPIPRHPKYKTEACQSYHKTGYCPYGPRCHFIHNEDPAVLTQLIAQNNAAMATAAHHQQQTLTQRPRNLSLQQTMSAPASTVATPLQRPYGSGAQNGMLPIGSRPPSNQSATRYPTSKQQLATSDGESPIPSSTDSDSECHMGSFSPGLDYDDSICRLSPNSFRRSLSQTTSRWSPSSSSAGAAVPGVFGTTTTDFWPSDASIVSGVASLSFSDSASKDSSSSIWDAIVPPVKTSSPTRLPVFERLSNNL